MGKTNIIAYSGCFTNQDHTPTTLSSALSMLKKRTNSLSLDVLLKLGKKLKWFVDNLSKHYIPHKAALFQKFEINNYLKSLDDEPINLQIKACVALAF